MLKRNNPVEKEEIVEKMKEHTNFICNICDVDADDSETFYEVLDYLYENFKLLKEEE